CELRSASHLLVLLGGLCLLVFFFFSSRRRHTRLVSDWSSDVCSSDLRQKGTRHDARRLPGTDRVLRNPAGGDFLNDGENTTALQIGRASCRERVEISVVGGSLKKKKNKSQEQRERGVERESARQGSNR